MEATQQPTPPQLDAHRFHLAEHEQNRFMCTVEPEVTRKQMLDPIFWAHVAAKWLRPYAEIIVRKDDGTLYARFLVLNSDRTWARVFCLEWHDLTTRDVSLSQGDVAKMAPEAAPSKQYEVKYMGPHNKWSVIRANVKPPEYVRKHEETEETAQTWLREWLKVQA